VIFARGLDLSMEAGQGIGAVQHRGVNDLRGHQLFHDLVLGQVDHPHAATPKLAEDAKLRMVN
jgi:hypothetical protein